MSCWPDHDQDDRLGGHRHSVPPRRDPGDRASNLLIGIVWGLVLVAGGFGVVRLIVGVAA